MVWCKEGCCQVLKPASAAGWYKFSYCSNDFRTQPYHTFKQDHEHVNFALSNSPTQQQHEPISPSGVIFILFNLNCINSWQLRQYVLSIIFTELWPNWIELICMGMLILAIFVTYCVLKQELSSLTSSTPRLPWWSSDSLGTKKQS